MAVSSETRHACALEASTRLSRYYVPDFIAPVDVARALERASIPFVLLGTHAFGGWMAKPRTCAEVEIMPVDLTSRAAGALEEAFQLRSVEASGRKTVLRREPKSLGSIHVWHASERLHRTAFAKGTSEKADGIDLRFPPLELALAIACDGVTHAVEPSDRYQHAHDFLAMVHANSAVDYEDLSVFGELLNLASDNLIAEVRQIRAGGKLTIL
jgi:hypothetical protein